MRGFWDVHGDFMGGPFVKLHDRRHGDQPRLHARLLHLLAQNPKRNYMRGVEHLLYLVKFPAAEAPQEEQRQ